jgi:hypothetical protein
MLHLVQARFNVFVVGNYSPKMLPCVSSVPAQHRVCSRAVRSDATVEIREAGCECPTSMKQIRKQPVQSRTGGTKNV